VPRGGRPRRFGEPEKSALPRITQDGGTHLGFRENAPPFAGRCRTGGLRDGLRITFAQIANHPVHGQTREGSALPRSACTTTRCAGPDRGGDSLVERPREPSLESARSEPGDSSSEVFPPLGSLAHVSRRSLAKSRSKAVVFGPKLERVVNPHGRMRGIGMLAVGARVSLCLQKSIDGLHAQRSVPAGRKRGRKPLSHSGVRERGLSRKTAGARKRKGFLPVKTRQLIRGGGDPHHVNAALENQAPWVRSHSGAGGLHGVATGGRHLGSGKRTSFTGRPRNRSWRPFESGESVRVCGASHGEGRRQGCQRRPSQKAP